MNAEKEKDDERDGKERDIKNDGIGGRSGNERRAIEKRGKGLGWATREGKDVGEEER